MENKQQGGSGWRMLLAVSVSHNNALFSCVILEIKRLVSGSWFQIDPASGSWFRRPIIVGRSLSSVPIRLLGQHPMTYDF